jgi:hypothetical protein
MHTTRPQALSCKSDIDVEHELRHRKKHRTCNHEDRKCRIMYSYLTHLHLVPLQISYRLLGELQISLRLTLQLFNVTAILLLALPRILNLKQVKQMSVAKINQPILFSKPYILHKNLHFLHNLISTMRMHFSYIMCIMDERWIFLPGATRSYVPGLGATNLLLLLLLLPVSEFWSFYTQFSTF